jgi:hypothetical protein
VPEAQSCLLRFGGNACLGGAVTYVGAARYDDPAMTHNWRMVYGIGTESARPHRTDSFGPDLPGLSRRQRFYEDREMPNGGQCPPFATPSILFA